MCGAHYVPPFLAIINIETLVGTYIQYYYNILENLPHSLIANTVGGFVPG